MNTPRIALKGAPGSPYTRKMLAILRYRHIPYRLLIGTRGAPPGMPQPKVELLPTFYLPDASGTLQAVVDSTPIIRRLEREIAGRSVLPADAGVRFLDELLEDYADEWLTRAMFHYRWHYAADIEKAGTILPHWRGISAPAAALAEARAQFSRRQIDRLYVVGSSPETAPVIEASYLRFLDAFNRHLEVQPFLMGARPGASDFGIYGQLTQLAHFDPTPAAITLARAPRVHAWVDLVDELSGLDPEDSGWITRDTLPGTLEALLQEVGRTHIPLLVANDRALREGASQVDTMIDGQRWVQPPFPYQGKCLHWLRESLAALPAPDRDWVCAVLERNGCAALIPA